MDTNKGRGADMKCVHRIALLFVSVALVCAPRIAACLPSVQTQTDTDGDATITLRQLTSGIVGDAFVWCELRVEVSTAQLPLTSGDTVSMWVYEDDAVADDLVWTSSFTVTPAEATAGNIDRTFQCAGAFGADEGSQWEVYAEVAVDKAACGTFCTPDHPKTAILFVQQVTDDAAEEDDTSSQAVSVFHGLTTDRISNDDADWVSFEVASTSRTDCTIVHDPGTGRLQATLLDGSFATVTVFEWTTGATVASEVLPVGTYYVVVGPADSADPNFYDLALELSPIAAVPLLPSWLRIVLPMSLVGSGAILLRVRRTRTDGPAARLRQ